MVLATSLFLLLLAANLFLYTSYDKSQKGLDPALLLDVVLARRGWRHTCVELNKVVALAGLTVLLVPLFPPVDGELRRECFLLATYSQIFHATFSFLWFYGEKNVPRISTWMAMGSELLASRAKVRAIGLKKLSIFFGGVATTWLIFWKFTFLPTALTPGAVVVAALSLLHFWSMEVHFKLSLKVRPFGWLPILLAVPAFLWSVSSFLL